MYKLVSEAEARKYRKSCSNVLKETCTILKSKDISAQFTLVGSGARNLITRNGNGPYDLDYNLEILKAPENLLNDPGKLKDNVRAALNKASNTQFSDAQDSTSVLTCLLYFKNRPNVKFKFDVAIVKKDRNGVYSRLIYDKHPFGIYSTFGAHGVYIWNQVPNSHNVRKKAEQIKKMNKWNLVRERYLDKKNRYLARHDNDHPSFIVYIETVNEIYSQLFPVFR